MPVIHAVSECEECSGDVGVRCKAHV